MLNGSDALVERYRQVQRALAASAGASVEFRVAASIGHLGLVARLVCPVFGAALFGYRLDLREAWWQPVLGGAMPLSVPTGAIVTGGGHLDLPGPVRDLTTVTGSFSVSPKVLWGNVASAVNGAAAAVARARPDLTGHALELGAALLADPGLVGSFTDGPGSDFRRLSCCLIYRIAPSGVENYCGDCILR